MIILARFLLLINYNVSLPITVTVHGDREGWEIESKGEGWAKPEGRRVKGGRPSLRVQRPIHMESPPVPPLKHVTVRRLIRRRPLPNSLITP